MPSLQRVIVELLRPLQHQLAYIIAEQEAMAADVAAIKAFLATETEESTGASQAELDALSQRIADTTVMVEAIQTAVPKPKQEAIP